MRATEAASGGTVAKRRSRNSILPIFVALRGPYLLLRGRSLLADVAASNGRVGLARGLASKFQ